MNNTPRKYAWIKQKSDNRDFKFSNYAAEKNLQLENLPKKVNNMAYCSKVEDQGSLGSCTAQAWCSLLEYNQNKMNIGSGFHDESRLFVYFSERELDGNINIDCGSTLRSGAKAIAKYGCCPESMWPYNIQRFQERPPIECYDMAKKSIIHNYYSLTNLQEMKACLAAGQCFVFGFMVYDYFESPQMAKYARLRFPKSNEQCRGGHAVMAVGYNDLSKTFLIRNSWGERWGKKGYFWMPYSYITNPNLADDFWTLVTSEY